MARVVVLSFGDNKVAEAFVQKLEKAQDPGSPPTWGESARAIGVIVASSSRVEAVLAQPTKYCDCPGNHKGEYAKTEHPGWYVHRTCGKPEKVLVERYIDNLIISGGNNLLEGLRDKWRKTEQSRSTAEVQASMGTDTEGSDKDGTTVHSGEVPGASETG